ncbi:MAG: hypothetical protein ACYSUX_17470 [Planctomycetota bacterium]|jgi:hypothetical protein
MAKQAYSDVKELDTLLSQINQQGLVSGADAKELVKILRGMGPRPSVEELAEMYDTTPGTTHVRLGRVVAGVLGGLHTHLVTSIAHLSQREWGEEIANWQDAYLDDAQPGRR